MAKIRSKNTKPEMYIRSSLYKAGLRYQLNCKDIFGHPDLYFKKTKTTVFVHGCYWHRHQNCKYAYIPKSNVAFWVKKFENNIARDSFVIESLLHEGKRILIIWECTISKMMKEPSIHNVILDRMIKFISTDTDSYIEI